MATALALVKRELGVDAVILHTRTVQRRGLLGLRSKQTIEVTASNDVNVLRRAGRPRSAEKPAAARNALLQRTYAPGSRGGATATLDAPTDVTQRSFGEVIRSGAVPLPVAVTAPVPTVVPGVADEVKQIHRMVHQMMRRTRATPDLPDALMQQYLSLLEQEVGEELAEEIVTGVRAELGAEQSGDDEAVREAALRRIAKLVPVSGDGSLTIERPRDGRPLTIALIGPTGVGKTTTVAKLAATFKLKHKLRVALVTIDTYRIAAVDQLRTYASIIQVPLFVAMTPAEMRESMAKCAGVDVILIDTAGRSQRDDVKLGQLSEFLDAAAPHQVHLVLSGTASQGVLMEAVERFGSMRYDRVIFTKLDEAVNFGVLLNVVRRVNKQLSYLTTGQEVPHQIEPGRPERLAGLILGERL